MPNQAAQAYYEYELAKIKTRFTAFARTSNIYPPAKRKEIFDGFKAEITALKKRCGIQPGKSGTGRAGQRTIEFRSIN